MGEEGLNMQIISGSVYPEENEDHEQAAPKSQIIGGVEIDHKGYRVAEKKNSRQE